MIFLFLYKKFIPVDFWEANWFTTKRPAFRSSSESWARTVIFALEYRANEGEKKWSGKSNKELYHARINFKENHEGNEVFIFYLNSFKIDNLSKKWEVHLRKRRPAEANIKIAEQRHPIPTWNSQEGLGLQISTRPTEKVAKR